MKQDDEFECQKLWYLGDRIGARGGAFGSVLPRISNAVTSVTSAI